MKNASKAVRDAYYNALNGNITYNGENVPVYKIEPLETTPKHYIEITNIDGANEQNDQKFIRPINITLDIVTTQYRYRNYDVADDIADQVNAIVLANVGGNLQDNDFQIGHIQCESERYLTEDNGDTLVTRKILQYTQTLIQY